MKKEKRAFWDKEHKRISEESGVPEYVVEYIRSRILRGSDLTIQSLISHQEEKISKLVESMELLARIIRKYEGAIIKGQEVKSQGKENAVTRYGDKAKIKKENNMKNHSGLVKKRDELVQLIQDLKKITDDQLKIILQEVKI